MVCQRHNWQKTQYLFSTLLPVVVTGIEHVMSKGTAKLI